jgi:hypothetical protein
MRRGDVKFKFREGRKITDMLEGQARELGIDDLLEAHVQKHNRHAREIGKGVQIIHWHREDGGEE